MALRASLQSESFSTLAQLLCTPAGSQTQTTSGTFLIQFDLVQVPNVIFLKSTINLPSAARTLPNSRYVTVVIPLKWLSEYRINAVSMGENSVFISSGTDGYFAKGNARSFFTIRLLRDRLISSIAALQCISADEVRIPDGSIELPRVSLARLRAQLGDLMKTSLRLPDQTFHHLASGSLENRIFDIFANLLVSEGMAQTEFNSCPVAKSAHIVHRAEDYFSSHMSEQVTLTQLCLATGVSRKRLHQAFRSIYDETPIRYFYKRKLVEAKTRLLHADREHGAISRTALGLGFTEFGRFSVEYRRLFGETPSATLLR